MANESPAYRKAAELCSIPPEVRRKLGKAATYEDIAIEVGVTVRTLSKWRAQQGFKDLVQEFEKLPVAGSLSMPPSETDDDFAFSPEVEAQFQLLEEMGMPDVDLARNYRRQSINDINAARFYTATWGKTLFDDWSETTKQAGTLSLAALADMALEALDILGPELVASWLKDKGYDVK